MLNRLPDLDADERTLLSEAKGSWRSAEVCKVIDLLTGTNLCCEQIATFPGRKFQTTRSMIKAQGLSGSLMATHLRKALPVYPDPASHVFKEGIAYSTKFKRMIRLRNFFKATGLDVTTAWTKVLARYKS